MSLRRRRVPGLASAARGVALAGLLAAGGADAGRPVFEGLTLEEVVSRSEAIVRAAPLAYPPEMEGCVTTFRFRLLEVLANTGGTRLPERGATLLVTDRGLAAPFDCEVRRRAPGGVSFKAPRYARKEGPVKLAALPEALLFLRRTGEDGELSFAADEAWETIRALERVTALVRPVAGAADFSDAVAGPDCSPWDGPALTLRLRTGGRDDVAGRSSLTVSVWEKPARLAGRKVALPKGGRGGGTALLEDSGRPAVRLRKGTIRFDRVEPGRGASGSYDLRFEDGRRLKGRFDARWGKDPVPCG